MKELGICLFPQMRKFFAAQNDSSGEFFCSLFSPAEEAASNSLSLSRPTQLAAVSRAGRERGKT
jgi:hypothetical protein